MWKEMLMSDLRMYFLLQCCMKFNSPKQLAATQKIKTLSVIRGRIQLNLVSDWYARCIVNDEDMVVRGRSPLIGDCQSERDSYCPSMHPLYSYSAPIRGNSWRTGYWRTWTADTARRGLVDQPAVSIDQRAQPRWQFCSAAASTECCCRRPNP